MGSTIEKATFRCSSALLFNIIALLHPILSHADSNLDSKSHREMSHLLASMPSRRDGAREETQVASDAARTAESSELVQDPAACSWLK